MGILNRLLIFIIMLSVLSTVEVFSTSGSTKSIEMSIDTNVHSTGKQVSVDVSIGSATDLGAITMHIVYDDANLSFNSYKETDLLSESNLTYVINHQEDDNIISLAGIALNPWSSDSGGVILTIEFDINDDSGEVTDVFIDADTIEIVNSQNEKLLPIINAHASDLSTQEQQGNNNSNADSDPINSILDFQNLLLPIIIIAVVVAIIVIITLHLIKNRHSKNWKYKK